jgi:TatD DNase family protein
LLFDSHVHLDDPALTSFVEQLDSKTSHLQKIGLIANSADIPSSRKTLELARGKEDRVFAFVGIHPQVFRSEPFIEVNEIERKLREVEHLAAKARGIGEVGLDPKFGNEKLQTLLFSEQLRIVEKLGKPVSIHSREKVSEVLMILKTHSLRANVLFHWFSGSESELARVQDAGCFASFGPSSVSSKRLQRLIALSDEDLLLAETDSPLRLATFGEGHLITPVDVASVIFTMALVRKVSFDSAVELNFKNAERFLSQIRGGAEI